MTVIKDLGYDSGDMLQWPTRQLKWPYSGTVVTDVRRKESGYAGRFEVRAGDDPIGDGHERAEVVSDVADINGTEGGEIYVGWSTYMPDPGLNPTPGGSSTNIFTQVHEKPPKAAGTATTASGSNQLTAVTDPLWQNGMSIAGVGIPNGTTVVSGGGTATLTISANATASGTLVAISGGLTTKSVPPLRVQMNAGGAYPYLLEARLCGEGGVVSTFSLGAPTYNAWMDFVFHVVWSSDPAVGLFEMWRDGIKVVQPVQRTTKYAGGYDNYLKQGWYHTNQAATSVIYHDETKTADSYADAKPPPRLTPAQGQVVRLLDGVGGSSPVFRRKIA